MALPSLVCGFCLKKLLLTDPNSNVTYTVYNDPNHEVRTYPGWTGTTTTGPIQVSREDRAGPKRGHRRAEKGTSYFSLAGRRLADPNHEVRVYPGWNGTTTTGPTQVSREDRAHDPSYVESFTMSATPHVTNGQPDGTEDDAYLQSL